MVWYTCVIAPDMPKLSIISSIVPNKYRVLYLQKVLEGMGARKDSPGRRNAGHV
jgi:hypothetical protein